MSDTPKDYKPECVDLLMRAKEMLHVMDGELTAAKADAFDLLVELRGKSNRSESLCYSARRLSDECHKLACYLQYQMQNVGCTTEPAKEGGVEP